MHILIFIEKLSVGGAERVASLWANGFIDNGYDVSIITCSQTEGSYPISKKINLYNIYPFSKSKIINKCAWIWKLRPLIKKINPTVIITLLYPWNFKVLLSSIGLGIPLINTEHGVLERPSHSRHSFFRTLAKFYFNRFFKIVTVLTKADQDFIRNRLKNTYVLPNPLAFTPASNISQKENVVLACGRYDAWHYKGFDLLIKAWSLLAKDFPNWKLRFIGAGSDKSINFLKNIAKDSEIATDSIEFFDFTSKIEDEYKKSAVFVLSSRYEAFGMVLIEAMSQGCACVACDYKGRQKEIIENDTQGVICSVENELAIAKALRRVISDEKYRHILQQNAIERSKYYELPNIMNRWDEIFDRIGVK